ncbi:MAG: UbiA prenyltransferase family protein [Thermoplasmata archaeon]|nr:MAG: UbiA prenyltransferase family protein [Thermoplasmata archaeon]
MQFREYAKLCHFQTASQIFAIPIIGALATQHPVTALQIAVLFGIGLLVNIFGFTHNEYLDVKIDAASDALSTKPLVKGTVPLRHAFILAYVSFILAFVLTIFFFTKPLPIAVFSLSIALAAIYNRFGKSYIGVDFLLAAWAFFLCLFGAFAVAGYINEYVRIFGILFLFQWWYANIVEGGVKDAEHDFKIGVRNTTTAWGVRVKKDKLILPTSYKIFGLVLSFGFVFVAVSVFIIYDLPSYFWQLTLIYVLCGAIIICAFILLNMKRFDRNLVLKLIIICEFSKAFLPPLILISIIGLSALLLVVFMFCWSAFFMLYEYGTSPPSI